MSYVNICEKIGIKLISSVDWFLKINFSFLGDNTDELFDITSSDRKQDSSNFLNFPVFYNHQNTDEMFNITFYLGPLLLTWINFNLRMDK